MGWLPRWWTRRSERASARAHALASARALLSEQRVREAFAEVERALVVEPGSPELMHLAAHVLRHDGQPETAELFDRAADAPADPSPWVELGSDLLTRDAPVLAASMLEHALALAPFDAVARSELALAHARRGRPDRVVETLALHPCLADDPGALFEFGWASLLAGDLDAAAGALDQLPSTAQTRSLHRKLENALARARVRSRADPDARDFFFWEHASLLLDSSGPHAGRYDAVDLDERKVGGLVARAAWALSELAPAPRRVVALDELEMPLAKIIARGLGVKATMIADERLEGAIVPMRDASALERIDRARLEPLSVVVVALVMDWSRPLPRVPEIAGIHARSPHWHQQLSFTPSEPGTDADLLTFVRERRSLLAPGGSRVRSAYVPDAPLSWPE